MNKCSLKANTKEVKLQLLDEIPECEYEINDNSELTVVVYASGKKSVEGKVVVHIAGTNSIVNIYGIFVTSGECEVRLHTVQHHTASVTTSNLLIKSVLREHAKFIYDGAIRVEKEGQKTDAYQRNENLLLSSDAYAQSKPSLEILANDVRCTHGATIGTIDKEQLFYLATRGVSESEGRNLIVEGFLNSVLTKISDPKKVENVREVVWRNL